MKFDWDAANEQHIARHGINPEEAEEVVLIEPLGRLLTVLFTERRSRVTRARSCSIATAAIHRSLSGTGVPARFNCTNKRAYCSVVSRLTNQHDERNPNFVTRAKKRRKRGISLEQVGQPVRVESNPHFHLSASI